MENNTNLESLCRKCGLCCHLKIGLLDGTFVIHPYVTCKYLTTDNTCEVYSNRAEAIERKICFTGDDIINKDYIVVEGCPYAELRPGYKAVRRVTAEEFNRITLDEMLKGNFNLMKLAEMLEDPNTYWKIIASEEE